jgi:hypothetical protein
MDRDELDLRIAALLRSCHRNHAPRPLIGADLFAGATGSRVGRDRSRSYAIGARRLPVGWPTSSGPVRTTVTKRRKATRGCRRSGLTNQPTYSHSQSQAST